MGGATADNDGFSGLVPTPKKGQQNFFLKGDGTWSKIADFDENNFSQMSGKVSLLGFEEASAKDILRKSSTGKLEWVDEEEFFSELNGKITTLENMIERIEGGVSRKIVESIYGINPEAADAENYIYMVPKVDPEDNNLYDEYMVIEKKVEKIGSGLSGNISGYVSTQTFNTTVSGLSKKIEDYVHYENVYKKQVGSLESINTILDGWTKDTIVEQVDFLTDLLTWYQL
jgi:hypothetical protein